MNLTKGFASTLAIIVVSLALTLIGYLFTRWVFQLLLMLFVLVAIKHAFRVCTVMEMLQDSLGVMKGMLVGEEGDWLRRASLIGLLCGVVLRFGHSLMLAGV